MKAHIWKQRDKTSRFYNMWCFRCSCGKKGQFWFFGASLGYILEHHRRGCKT